MIKILTIVSATTVVLLLAIIIDFIWWRNAHLTSIKNQLKTVEVSGSEIAYTDIGSGEPILYIYGGGSGPDSVSQFRWLADEGYRLISVNREGYLGRPLTDGVTFATQADDAAAVLEALGIEKAHIFGVSMGGPGAITFADRYPQKSKSLMLWSAISKTYAPNPETADTPLARAVLKSPASIKDLISWSMARSARFFPATLMTEFLRTEADLSDQETKDIIHEELKVLGRKRELIEFINSITPMSARFDGMMYELDLTEGEWYGPFRHPEIPLLSAHSQVDTDVPIDHQTYVQQQRPDGVFVTVRAGGHFCWWGIEGNRVRDATLAFLADHAR